MCDNCIHVLELPMYIHWGTAACGIDKERKQGQMRCAWIYVCESLFLPNVWREGLLEVIQVQELWAKILKLDLTMAVYQRFGAAYTELITSSSFTL